MNTYFIILDKHSTQPSELLLSEESVVKERFSIICDERAEGQILAHIPALSMSAALARAQELRQQAIDSGDWDIICDNYKNTII